MKREKLEFATIWKDRLEVVVQDNRNHRYRIHGRSMPLPSFDELAEIGKFNGRGTLD